MPTGTPFKYAGTYNTANDNFLGAGFDGIPVIFELQAQGEVDVTGFYKYTALSARDICSFYWNFAGINFSASASVPLLSFTIPGDPPETLSNTKSGSVSFSGDLLLENNSNGEGFDPSQRMFAYPDRGTYLEGDSENSGDPWPFTLRIDAGVSSVSTIVKLMSGEAFLGYGMNGVCDVEVFATNRSAGGVQSSTERVIISSFFETENSDFTYSQRVFGDATFWQAEQNSYINNSDGTAEDPVYILPSTTSLGTINPVFFSY